MVWTTEPSRLSFRLIWSLRIQIRFRYYRMPLDILPIRFKDDPIPTSQIEKEIRWLTTDDDQKLSPLSSWVALEKENGEPIPIPENDELRHKFYRLEQLYSALHHMKEDMYYHSSEKKHRSPTLESFTSISKNNMISLLILLLLCALCYKAYDSEGIMWKIIAVIAVLLSILASVL